MRFLRMIEEQEKEIAKIEMETRRQERMARKEKVKEYW